jgi:phage protein D
MSGIPKNESYQFDATVSGLTFTQAEPGGLLQMVIEDHVDMIGVARFTISQGQEEWASIKLGSDVEVKVGASGRKMFVGLVTGLRHTRKGGQDALVVMAMDPLIKASSSRRTKVYEDMTDSDIVQEVIGAAGLEAGKVDSTEGQSPYVLQRNESDLEFMKRLAARNNYLLLCNEGKVDFVKPQFSGQSVEVSPDMVESLDYTMNAVSVPPNMTTYGWDYVETSTVEGTAGSGDIEAIGGGENAVSAAAKIWGGTSYVSDVEVSSQGGAKGIAVAELNRLARNFLRGTARVDGNADIHAGAKVKFKGYSTGFNPEIYVLSARHLFQPKRGYATEFQFCGNTMPE